MSDKTKPPQAPKYPKGSPVKGDKRSKGSAKSGKNETSLLSKLLNCLKH